LDITHDSLLNVTLMNTLLVCIVVVIHNEVLLRLSGLLAKMRQGHHFRLIIAVLGCLTAHGVQVWFCFRVLPHAPCRRLGAAAGQF